MLANFFLNAPCAGRVQCTSSRKLCYVWSEPRTFVHSLKICKLTPELAPWEHSSVTQNSAGYGEKVQCVESSRCIWAVFVLFSREKWIAAIVWQKNISNSRVLRRIVALGSRRTIDRSFVNDHRYYPVPPDAFRERILKSVCVVGHFGFVQRSSRTV